MTTFGALDWLTVVGLGMVWLGWQIVAVGGLPRTIVARGGKPLPPRGAPEHFQLFWIEQYRVIGLVLGVAGLVSAVVGAVA